MKRRLAALAVVALFFLSLCVSQVWYTVCTSVSPNLSFTGSEFDSSLTSLLLLVGLMTLVALYLKTRMAAVLHAASLVLVVISCSLSGFRIATGDLKAVESKIERATGVVGWISQKTEVVTKVELSFWPLLTLVPALVLATALAVLAFSARGQKKQPAGSAERANSKNTNTASDLWSETSNQL